MDPEDHAPDGRLLAPPPALVRRLVVAVWWVVLVILGVASGYVLAAPQWTDPSVPYWTAGGACVGLAIAAVVGCWKVHPWWGAATVWGAFMVGMVPPISDDDALWIAAALVLGVMAAGYLVVVNLVVIAVRSRSRRRSSPS